ncbi:serine/threonine-protein kinase STN7, chloroplastic isoform X2 [Coffea arabica]|uniref:Serine/threonine-protein kinase STN7, chloroplastic isoform X2 n=1 Tax=Coffea arabica TaxID=13443 RepID=A0ABM4W952_COFAR
MATVATSGVGLSGARLHAFNSSKPFSPFLGKKLKIKPISESIHPTKFNHAKSRNLLVLASGVDLMSFVNDLFVGVGVGLPCTVMACGDIIYRSTLPSSNGLTVTVPGTILALGALSYLWATPGVAPGFFDMFVLAFVERLIRPTYRKEDFVLGKKLGEGSFGVVYRASWAKKPSPKGGELVLKKATEYGAVEIWMNERLRRACASSCADFVYGFLESSSKKQAEYWLIWRFEGEATLADLMQSSRTFKIIDHGAAADLRVGINYIPKEFLLDPRYAAPEQYIMSTQTPSAPSVPVATALSPVLWQLNLPDRFDIYSAGLVFLQMAFPGLRNDNSLIQFNRQLKRCDYDLVAWRNTVEPRASNELRRGFELLDLDGGIGWELLTSMVRYKARQRVSAKEALAHPYFDREGLLAMSFMQNLRMQYYRATQKDYSEALKWVVRLMAKSGTEQDGGFTEAQLQELRDIQPKKKSSAQRNALASALKLQRKITRTLKESVDELNQRRKSVWWNRWIPREE